MVKLSTNKLLLKANAHARKGETDMARQLYQTVLDKFPSNKRARRGLTALPGGGVAKPKLRTSVEEMQRLTDLLDCGKPEQVTQEAEALLKTQEKNEVLWNIYGTALARLDKHQPAEHAFWTATRLAPDFTIAHLNLAKLYDALDQVEPTVDTYRDALASDPGSTQIMIRLGNALVERGDQHEALACFNGVLSREPDNVAALRALGVLLSQFQRFDEALTCFDRALTLDGDNLSLLRNMINLPPGFLTHDQLDRVQASLTRLDVDGSAQVEKLFVQAQLERNHSNDRAAFEAFCKFNAEMLKTIPQADLDRKKEKRAARLKLARHWQPGLIADKADVQTLVILGPSRSGKTTLETILQRSPHVANMYEKWRYRGRLRTLSNVKALADGTPESAKGPLALDEVFYAEQAQLHADGKRVVTATNPTFIQYVTTLADHLPGVRFCHVQRDPVEIATEIFATNYKRGNLHSYDPAALLDYLHWYDEMLAQVLDKAQGIRLRFEDILARPDEAVAQVETLLGRDLRIRDTLPIKTLPRNPMTGHFQREFMK